jgi:hypothetical protein
MRGDLLFYEGDGSFTDRVICFFTGGRFSHVAVQVDNVALIESVSPDGVRMSVLELDDPRVTTVPIRSFAASEADIDAGIRFLRAEVGTKYSYLDCLNSIPFFKRIGIAIAVRGRFDCSHLVAEYIKYTNSDLTKTLYPDDADTAAVSPNDIARAAGLK